MPKNSQAIKMFKILENFTKLVIDMASLPDERGTKSPVAYTVM